MFQYFRIFVLAVKSFREHNCPLHASALTYLSLLSIVPLLALAFGIAKGFDFTHELEMEILKNFEGQQEISIFFQNIFIQANEMLARTKGGLMAGLGLVLLFYTIMKLMGSIEASFNTIWAVKKPRTLLRKFTDYLTMVVIAPIFVFITSSLNLYINTELTELTTKNELISYFGPIIEFVLGFSPYFLIWMLFTLIYLILPNARVKYEAAIIAGIVAGTMYQLFQWGYINFQVGVSRYNAIYGSFAALPLFLVWLQSSWYILLFGAEISYSFQNVNKFETVNKLEELSVNARFTWALSVLYIIVRNFHRQEPPVSISYLAEKLETSRPFIRQVTDFLVKSGLINTLHAVDETDHNFQPAVDIHQITIDFALKRMENTGLTDYPVKKINILETISSSLGFLNEAQSSTSRKKLLFDL